MFKLLIHDYFNVQCANSTSKVNEETCHSIPHASTMMLKWNSRYIIDLFTHIYLCIYSVIYIRNFFQVIRNRKELQKKHKLNNATNDNDAGIVNSLTKSYCIL